MEGPDIPPWLYVKYTKKNNNLYIFGAAPKDLSIELLEVIFHLNILVMVSLQYKLHRSTV